MVRNIKTKWEWIADTIDNVIQDIGDRNILKNIALKIEKNMALAYPYAPTNPLWEEIYPQLLTDDLEDLVDRFIFVCHSGAETCAACFILNDIRNIEFPSDDDEDHETIRGCEFCRYGKIAGICEDSGSLYQIFQRMFASIIRYQSNLNQEYKYRWEPELEDDDDFENITEDDDFGSGEY